MENYWQTPEHAALKKEFGGWLAGVIVRSGCKTLAEFCEKYDDVEMLRLPRMGHKLLRDAKTYAAQQNIAFRERPLAPTRARAHQEPRDDNDLFLLRWASFDGIILGIGTRRSRRKISLSDDEALKLAYRLMSLAKGGETHGFEKFEREG